MTASRGREASAFFFFMKIIAYNSLASTNSRALELAAEERAEETVVWARCQTAGRGQHGRVFSSPPGGLYFSLILRPKLKAEHLSLVTLAAGVACSLALKQQCGLTSGLKWPNDLYCRHRKLGGILTETLPVGGNHLTTVIIGVGLNINSLPGDFPPEVRELVTSIQELTGRNHDLEQLLYIVVREIIDHVRILVLDQKKLLALWRQRDYFKGQPLRWETEQQSVVGIGCGLLADGRYALKDNRGKIHAILGGSIQPIVTVQPDTVSPALPA